MFNLQTTYSLETNSQLKNGACRSVCTPPKFNMFAPEKLVVENDDFPIQKGNFSGAMINLSGKLRGKGGGKMFLSETCPNSPAHQPWDCWLHGPIEVQHQRLTEILTNGFRSELPPGMVLKPLVTNGRFQLPTTKLPQTGDFLAEFLVATKPEISSHVSPEMLDLTQASTRLRNRWLPKVYPPLNSTQNTPSLPTTTS